MTVFIVGFILGVFVGVLIGNKNWRDKLIKALRKQANKVG